jgi:hypothetical protein
MIDETSSLNLKPNGYKLNRLLTTIDFDSLRFWAPFCIDFGHIEQDSAQGWSSVMGKETNYELDQKDGQSRGLAVSRERSDQVLRHHLCPEQTDRIW